MTKRTIEVTAETMGSLADKLEGFREQLTEEEQVLLSAVVAAGAPALTSEVEGFSAGKGGSIVVMDPTNATGSTPLGSLLRSVGLPGISGLKFEVDVIETKGDYR